MNYARRVPFGKSLAAFITGFVIFVVSQILGAGYELSQWVYAHKQVGLELPVPWHLQTFAFLLAAILTALCFLTIFKGKYQRTALVFTLVACFFVLLPLGWLSLIAHGHLDMMADGLLHFPTVLKQANTWIEEEQVIEIPTLYGTYKYRFYWDRKSSEYVYEVWREQNILFSQRIYNFTRRCLNPEPSICPYITIPFTPVDLSMVGKDYAKSVVTSGNEVRDINGDGAVDLVIHEYSGNGDLSQYRIFSLGKILTWAVRPAPDPK